MNRDQIKGGAREVAGKVEKGAGKMVGSTKTQAKGMAREVAGKMQKEVGNAEEAGKKAAKRTEKDAQRH